MKKIFGVIVMILLIGSLAACNHNNSDSKPNRISAADLSDREDTILSTISSKSFVFTFNNTDYREVTLWIEKYEDGELVDDQLGGMTTQVGERGSIVLANAKLDHEEQLSFLIGTGDEDGTASAHVLDENLRNEDFSSTVYSGLPGEKTLDDDEIVLANIAYSNNEFGMSSISNQFFEDPEIHMDELKEYSVAYLFKVVFVE